MKKHAAILSLGAFLGLAACEAQEPVPSKPTWANDVLPILRANCFNCHAGDTEKVGGNTTRFDAYETMEEPSYEGLQAALPAIGTKTFITAIVLAATRDERRMPPPPAEPLSERDIAVLRAFQESPEKGRRSPNRRPSARLVSRRVTGGKLVVTFDVRDGDLDPVVGKATVDGTDFLFKQSGRIVAEFEGAAQNAAVTVEMSDGFEKNTVNL